MVPKWRAMLVACVVPCISAAAQAADPVPDRSGAFVAYCASHFPRCTREVQAVDVGTMAKMLFADKPGESCAIPKGIADDAATREILAWIGRHRNPDDMKTDEAIRIAVKDLWHCASQVGDGTVPGGPPARTAEFVAYCSSQYAKCANEIVAVSVAVLAQEPRKHCSPPDSMSTRDLTTAVLAWLPQHREADRLETDAGIMAAFDHLWPCHQPR